MTFDLQAALRRPEVMKSLAIHRAIHDKIMSDGDPLPYLRIALEKSRWAVSIHPNDPWLAEWIDMLETVVRVADSDDNGALSETLSAFIARWLAETEHGIDLRQSAYFGQGRLLSNRERREVIQSCRLAVEEHGHAV
jgi:hypothetical protein